MQNLDINNIHFRRFYILEQWYISMKGSDTDYCGWFPETACSTVLHLTKRLADETILSGEHPTDITIITDKSLDLNQEAAVSKIHQIKGIFELISFFMYKFFCTIKARHIANSLPGNPRGDRKYWIGKRNERLSPSKKRVVRSSLD